MARITKENIAPAPKGGYEAFYYEWHNTTKGKTYGGKRKGYVGDGYQHSSESKEMNNDYQDMTQEWVYSVLFYGTADDITNKEREILKGIDARNNPNWYNQTNGGSVYKVAPNDLIKTIVDGCNNREYLVLDADGVPKTLSKTEISDLLSGDPIQVRGNNSDPSMTKLVQILIDDKGDTSKTDPLILIEDKKGNYRLLNGNTTGHATLNSKHGKYLQYQVIPYDLIKNCTENDLRGIGLALNPKMEKPTNPSTTFDASIYILEEYRKNKRPVRDKSNVDYLENHLKFNSSARNKVFAEVEAKIKKGHANITTPIIRYSAPQNKHIVHQQKVYIESKIQDCKVFSYASSIIRYNDIVTFLMNNDKIKGKNKMTSVKLIIHHPSYTDEKKWLKSVGELNQDRMDSLCSKYGLAFMGFHMMPMI